MTISTAHRGENGAMIWTLPNILTIFRMIAATALPLIAAWAPFEWAAPSCAVLFTAGAVTDAADGWIARRFNAGSDFGRMLDPIADKCLIGCGLLTLLALEATRPGANLEQAVSYLLAPIGLILIREFFVSGMREFVAEAGGALRVSGLGKLKTVLQSVAMIILFASLSYPFSGWAWIVGVWLLWAAAGLTLMSGFNYARAGMSWVK